MGQWGPEPWDNDMAADWFMACFAGIDIDKRIEAALRLGYDHEFDELRAACYILEVLGRTYVWPGDINKLDELLKKGMSLLSEAINPETKWGKYFLDWWGDYPEQIASIERQIQALTARLERK